MRRDDLAVLLQAAIAHAQFETIHPFPDGNGRTSRRQATVWRVLDVVFQHPVLDNGLVQRELGVSVMGAAAAITELVGIGALEEITGGRRNRRYAAVQVLAALDAFAEQVEGRGVSGANDDGGACGEPEAGEDERHDGEATVSGSDVS